MQEIGYVTQVFFASSIDLDVKPNSRRLIEVSRNLNTWRKTGNVLSHFPEQMPIDRQLNVNKIVEDIMLAYERGYKAAEQAAIQEVHVDRQRLLEAESRGDLLPPDAEPVLVKTVARAILATNEANPFELLERTQKALLAMYHSRNWALRTDQERYQLEEACNKLFGYTLDALSLEHQRLSDL